MVSNLGDFEKYTRTRASKSENLREEARRDRQNQSRYSPSSQCCEVWAKHTTQKFHGSSTGTALRVGIPFFLGPQPTLSPQRDEAIQSPRALGQRMVAEKLWALGTNCNFKDGGTEGEGMWKAWLFYQGFSLPWEGLQRCVAFVIARKRFFAT